MCVSPSPINSFVVSVPLVTVYKCASLCLSNAHKLSDTLLKQKREKVRVFFCNFHFLPWLTNMARLRFLSARKTLLLYCKGLIPSFCFNFFFKLFSSRFAVYCWSAWYIVQIRCTNSFDVASRIGQLSAF